MTGNTENKLYFLLLFFIPNVDTFLTGNIMYMLAVADTRVLKRDAFSLDTAESLLYMMLSPSPFLLLMWSMGIQVATA